jgi:hypothetical protein
MQTIQAKNLTLRDLKDNFGLQLTQNQQFFSEWREDLPELNDSEKYFLDKVKLAYFNLVSDPPLLEKPIQMSIVAPLLFLADFYLPPFQVKAEKSIELVEEDEGITVRGSLDLLILKDDFWLLVIESKRASFSIEAGLAQLLAYMLSSPQSEQPGFGMITTGGSFIFIKLMKGSTPQYATSNQFDLRREANELYDVLRILKRISQI